MHHSENIRGLAWISAFSSKNRTSLSVTQLIYFCKVSRIEVLKILLAQLLHTVKNKLK
jgi:hypothetical protein